MSPWKLFGLFVLLLFPLLAHSQDTTTVDLDKYVEQVNAQCPILYSDSWSINSFTPVGINYVLVDVHMPSNLSMFLSTLTEDKDNVKRMWIRQLKQYGERWNKFVDVMVDNDRRIVLNLCPEGSDESALITLLPSDFSQQ